MISPAFIRKFAFAVLFLFLIPCAVSGAPSALPDAPGWKVAVPLDYSDDAAAQAVWRPMASSAPAVESKQAGPRRAVGFPVRFVGNAEGRMVWDGACALDFSRARSVCLRFYCDEPLPASSITVYLKSGAGYYAIKPPLPEPGQWRAVELDRMTFGIEGTPGPWSEISSVRIAVWRPGDAGDGALWMADVGMREGDSRITLLRNDAAAAGGKQMADSIRTLSAAASAFLGELGLDYGVVSDLDLTVERLKDVRVLVMPYTPRLGDSAADTISGWAAAGGKVVAFYALPGKLYEAAGMRHLRYLSGRDGLALEAVEPDASGALAGMPSRAGQHSRNIQQVEPVPGRSRVAGWWVGADGKRTPYPAILVSENWLYMSHVLLPEDPGAKKQLLMALLGHFLPDVWERGVRAAVAAAGSVGGYEGLDALGRAIGDSGGDPERLLTPARACVARAEDCLRSGDRIAAFAAATEAIREARRAWCAAQSPRAGEKRAFWCHFPYGPVGMDWEQSARVLGENGFNMLIPNLLWGGVAYYPSEVLPVAPEVATKGDAVRQCLDACRRHGLECHVWKVHWRIHKGPKDFQERMVREGRVQVGFDGKVNGEWLCPTHPENRRMEIDSMVEVARRYEVDGMHSDYIRYPGPDVCFCATCRAAFEKEIGAPVANWPKDVRADAALGTKWNDFRRRRITTLVADISAALRGLPRAVRYSAAVFPNWSLCRQEKAQDWKEWCDRGYVDFLCPMDYTADDAVFRTEVANQMRWAGKTPILPGIGITTWADRTDALGVIGQIRIARELGAAGFTIFHLDTTEAKEVAPLLGAGITRRVP